MSAPQWNSMCHQVSYAGAFGHFELDDLLLNTPPALSELRPLEPPTRTSANWQRFLQKDT
eukprot:5776646-Amphidinium_carterae.1